MFGLSRISNALTSPTYNSVVDEFRKRQIQETPAPAAPQQQFVSNKSLGGLLGGLPNMQVPVPQQNQQTQRRIAALDENYLSPDKTPRVFNPMRLPSGLFFR